MSATGTSGTPAARRDRPLSNPETGHDHGRRLATETKAAYKTTEFVAYIAVVAGILISAASITGGGAHRDFFQAGAAWLFVSIVTAGYMISRGLAKAGNKQPYDENS